MAEKDPTPFNVLSVTTTAAGDNVDGVDETPSSELAPSQRSREEPPVVARLVVEVRSDGSQTIARGALEDLDSGVAVKIEAHGRSPASLAWSLAKTLANAPALRRHRPKARDPKLIESGSSQEPRHKIARTGIFGRLRRHIKRTRPPIYDRLKKRVQNKQDKQDVDDQLDSSE